MLDKGLELSCTVNTEIFWESKITYMILEFLKIISLRFLLFTSGTTLPISGCEEINNSFSNI